MAIGEPLPPFYPYADSTELRVEQLERTLSVLIDIAERRLQSIETKISSFEATLADHEDRIETLEP